jgi:SsrA-binding protein
LSRQTAVAKKHDKQSLAPKGSVLTLNRRALHDYHVLERIEAGVQLLGSEVKSVRDGKVSLLESFAQFTKSPTGGELWLLGAHIAEYVQAHRRNHEPLRRRKLLLHRKELDRLEKAVAQAGLTLVPLAMYIKNGYVKVELGLCQGKQMHDKRASLKEREQRLEMDRAMRARSR